MSIKIFESLRRRRVLPWLGAYLAGGFLALEGVDQLVGNSLLPAVSYRVALVFYLCGFPGTFILAWFHGEKGTQKPPRTEIWLQTSLLAVALALSVFVLRSDRATAAGIDLASSLGLDPHGVAVLYFEDLSEDGELGFVADGLTEALIERLAEVRSLDVVSPNGVEAFRGLVREVGEDSIARVLRVGSLIEGSVEPRGDRLRVETRFVDGISGAVFERTTFELPAGDFLSIRDSVSRNISSFLRQRLGAEVSLRESRAGTSSADAWSLLQRAERLRKDASSLERGHELDLAIARLQQADSILALSESADPSWSRPPTARARMAFRRGYIRAALQADYEAGALALEEGLSHVGRALGLAPNDAAALEARGTLNYTLWLLDLTDDPEAAERLLAGARADLERAVDVDPGLASAWSMLSHLYMQLADNNRVALAARRAYEEDAFLDNADQILNRLFWAHYDLEQFRDAASRCREGAARFPENDLFVECRLWLLLAPTETVIPDSAWSLYDALLARTAETERPYAERLGHLLVGGALRRAELPDSAEAVLVLGRGDPEVDPTEALVVQEARIRAATGDQEGAMQALTRYIASHPSHSFEVGGQLHWMWRSLRDRPDFKTLLSRD